MKNVKKNIFNAVFLLVVFACAVYGVLKGEDVGKVFGIIKGARMEFIIFGVTCVLIFIWGESIIIYYLMYSLSIKLKKWKCFLFSSVGFFQLHYTVGKRWAANADLLYEKRKNTDTRCDTGANDCDDYI